MSPTIKLAGWPGWHAGRAGRDAPCLAGRKVKGLEAPAASPTIKLAGWPGWHAGRASRDAAYLAGHKAKGLKAPAVSPISSLLAGLAGMLAGRDAAYPTVRLTIKLAGLAWLASWQGRQGCSMSGWPEG